MSRSCTIDGCQLRHLARGLCSKHYWRWQKYGDANAGVTMRADGTGCVTKSGHIRVTVGGRTRMEHDLIAERALGKPLPQGACVHHANRDPSDNRNENLVVCPNQKYHSLLHQRMRAYDACGNANWRKCSYCKQYDDPTRMTSDCRDSTWHPSCANAANKASRERRKAR